MTRTEVPDETRRPPAGSRHGATEGTSGVVRVVVNGEPLTLAPGTTLADLLRAHDLDPRLVVVEHNRAILRDRDAFPHLVLAEGDALELVHFVGGG